MDLQQCRKTGNSLLSPRGWTILFVALLYHIFGTDAVSFNADLTITSAQKLKLDKFRAMVGPKLPHDYMREDIYLIRWLRARNFNLQAARAMLMENIQWRKQNDIDNILNEDWSDIERDYKYSIEGCDNEGRPIATMFAGDWDVRRAVVAGKGQRLMRYFDRFFEEMVTLVRRAQTQGKNVTQYAWMFEMNNYNLVQQGCPLCIPVYVYLVQSYENHWPDSVHQTWLVNTPSIFQSVWQILSPLISERTRNSVFIYGKKNEWQPALRRQVAPEKITQEFGGTKPFSLELGEIRNNPGKTFDC